MAQKRAPKGGTTAINGEFYQGGEFLPTTEMPSQSKASKTVKVYKVEIAPYKWAMPAEGQRSIYKQLAGIYGKVVNDTFVVNCSDTTIAYYGTSRDEVESLADRWNKGERWI